MSAEGARARGRLEARLNPRVLGELRDLPIRPDRPLLVVDCDEVMVDFAGHLGRFAESLGIVMRLERYELEGAFRETSTGRRLAFPEAIGLIQRFFAEETARQAALPGAAEALDRLSDAAQIVVLTNVPHRARPARIANLAGLGMGYPLVANEGGKGRALAWLASRLAPGVPIAFVDDSPSQIASAARRAEAVRRVQFLGAVAVRGVIPAAPEADHRVASWAAAEGVIRRHLGG